MPPDTPPTTPAPAAGHRSPLAPPLRTHLALIAAATVILTGFSALWTIGYQSTSNAFVHLTHGVVAFGRSAALMPDSGWHFDPHGFAVRWWGHASTSRANVWSVSIPLWIPALLAAALAAALHHRRARPPRRAPRAATRSTPCPHCGYDLAGLPDRTTTPCPECGHPPRPPATPTAR